MLERSSLRTVSARLFLFALVLAIPACGGDSTGVENVASIRMTPESPSIDVGLSVRFEAEALDANGNVLPGIAFAWSSSDPAIAAVDENGLATANAVGTTAITASAGSATPASQVLIVEPDQCDGRVDVVLSAGESETYDGDVCLFVPSGATGDRYRVAITRPKLIEDPNDVPNVTLRVDPIFTAEQLAGAAPVAPSFASVGGSGTASRQLEGLLDGTQFVRDHRIMEHTRRFHADLRRREIEVGLRSRGLMPERPRRAPAGPARAGGPSLAPPPDRDELFLALECSPTATRSPVLLLGSNDDVAIYQDSVENQTRPLSQGSVDLLLDYWERHIAGLVDDYWGTTPDIDGNERVLLTTSSALPDSAAAGVFSGDFRSTADCASSNEGEIMYFATDVIRGIDDIDSPSYLALSVMAHEVKHVTSLYHAVAREAIYGPGQGFHNIWIEEGTAEVSQTMSSRVAWASIGGPPVGTRITGSDLIDGVTGNGGDVPPEMWGVVTQVADLIVQMSSQPNSLITNPAGAAEFHTFYAAGWHWHRFLGDAHGGAATPFADGPMFTALTDSLTLRGVGGWPSVIGSDFDQIFEDVTIATAFADAGPQPALAFTTWDMATATAIFARPADVAPPGDYPWPVTVNATSGNQSRSLGVQAVYSCGPQLDNDRWIAPAADARCAIGPAGTRFHEFVSSGSGAGAQLRTTGVPDGKITVSRIN